MVVAGFQPGQLLATSMSEKVPDATCPMELATVPTTIVLAALFAYPAYRRFCPAGCPLARWERVGGGAQPRPGAVAAQADGEAPLVQVLLGRDAAPAAVDRHAHGELDRPVHLGDHPLEVGGRPAAAGHRVAREEEVRPAARIDPQPR